MTQRNLLRALLGLASTPEMFARFATLLKPKASHYSDKPWVQAIDQKIRAGATSPSITTRQQTRAAARTTEWAQHRMAQTWVGKKSKRLVLRNESGLDLPRRERRAQAFSK